MIFVCLHISKNPWRIESPSLIHGNDTRRGRGVRLGNVGDERGTSIKTKCRRKSVLRKHMGASERARQREEEEERRGSAGPASDMSSYFEKNPVIFPTII